MAAMTTMVQGTATVMQPYLFELSDSGQEKSQGLFSWMDYAAASVSRHSWLSVPVCMAHKTLAKALRTQLQNWNDNICNLDCLQYFLVPHFAHKEINYTTKWVFVDLNCQSL